MELFKDLNGAVFAYDAEQVEAGLAEDKVKLTQEEVDAHTAPRQCTHEEIRMLRRVAYADPRTGCDGWFSEAARLSVMGGTAEEIAIAHDKGVARYEEIGLEYPWP